MTTKTKGQYKVCDACGHHCPINASTCTSCGKTRFAPLYVKELRRVNKAVSVQVRTAHPNAESQEPVITLSKWWYGQADLKGGSSNFNIKTPAQWESIKNIVETELGPLLSWMFSSSARKQIKATVSSTDLAELSKQHPEKFAEVVKALKVRIDGLPADDNERLFSVLADLVSNFDKASMSKTIGIIEKLRSESTTSIERLDEVLSDWSLSQVTAVVRETKRRLATVELLRSSLKDEKTFELRGDNSIHSILERDLWLLDESYWLIQSNQTLRTFIGDQLSKEDAKRYGKKRPDFVCGAVGEKLIIIELKRPSHELSVGDLNQLEKYLALSDKYSTKFRSYQGFLLGSSISGEIRTYLKYRRGIDVLNYWEVLDAAEKRYKAFLKHREDDMSAVVGRPTTPLRGVRKKRR